jgi:hypothetical protein
MAQPPPSGSHRSLPWRIRRVHGTAVCARQRLAGGDSRRRSRRRSFADAGRARRSRSPNRRCGRRRNVGQVRSRNPGVRTCDDGRPRLHDRHRRLHARRRHRLAHAQIRIDVRQSHRRARGYCRWRLPEVSEGQNPELFWGLRGGGGNFGVVTSFEYRLHKVGPIILGGVAFYRADKAVELLRFYRTYIEKISDELTTVVVFVTGPPAPFMPPQLHGAPLVGIVASAPVRPPSISGTRALSSTSSVRGRIRAKIRNRSSGRELCRRRSVRFRPAACT